MSKAQAMCQQPSQHFYIISTGVLIVGLSRKMRKQGVRISPPVEDGQEPSSYMCLYSHS